MLCVLCFLEALMVFRGTLGLDGWMGGRSILNSVYAWLFLVYYLMFYLC